jgi:predicted DNA-binding transcriptional regulator AlpA
MPERNATRDRLPKRPVDELWNEAETSERTRVARGTLRYWRSTKQGPRWFRLGDRKIAYLRSDVEAWLAEQYDASA